MGIPEYKSSLSLLLESLLELLSDESDDDVVSLVDVLLSRLESELEPLLLLDELPTQNRSINNDMINMHVYYKYENSNVSNSNVE